MAALEILELANNTKLGHVLSRILGYAAQAVEQSTPKATFRPGLQGCDIHGDVVIV